MRNIICEGTYWMEDLIFYATGSEINANFWLSLCLAQISIRKKLRDKNDKNQDQDQYLYKRKKVKLDGMSTQQSDQSVSDKF